MSATPAGSDYLARSKTAIAQRDASIPKELLLPQSQISGLPQDLTSIPRTSPHFTSDERTIITAPVTTLLSSIHSRTWTAEQVTRAFLKSAAVANQLTNCLTALLQDDAIARARELDAHLARTGQPVGPLHGLPISLKDCFITPPTPSALGLTSWAGESTEGVPESVLPAMLRDLGAIVHAKTNVPVGMMMLETDNHVTGPTSNPYNTACSAGGSSGGEAALIAMYGSPLGVGTDIGGSVRIPSAFCGLWSLKPSFGRLPTYGARSAIPGNDFIFSVNGPMCRSLEGIQAYCAAVMGAEKGPWTRDPKCLPLPWRGQTQTKTKLKLAFMPPHDGTVHAHPPVARALAGCRSACEKAGHEVADWEPIGHGSLLKSVEAGFFQLGGPAIQAQLDKTGEPWFTGMSKYANAAAKAKSSRFDGKLDGVLTADELREMNLIRNDLQKRHLDRWMESGVDAIVAPVAPWTAVRNGFTTKQQGTAYIGYTAVFSLLDVSVGTVVVGKVGRQHFESEDKIDESWDEVGGKPQPFGEVDEKIMDDWDADIYDGTPLVLQVIAGRLEEEKALSMVEQIATALKTSR